MDLTAQPNRFPTRLWNLPDELLVLIICCLPFKDCIVTSALSKRWRYLYRQTTNLAFKESDFVDLLLYVSFTVHARNAFVDYALQWVAGVPDHQVIESFEVSLSHPFVYWEDVKALIAFAVRKKVKKLVLDFTNPRWTTFRDVLFIEPVVEVPESVYNLQSLESLKVSGCHKFDPSRFTNPEIFKSLSFGWMRLTNLESFLSKSSRLESLSINDCALDDVKVIAGDMREFSLEKCDFPSIGCSFKLPKVDILKYSGDVFCFHFERMNAIIKEVHLDFGVLGDYYAFNDTTLAEREMLIDILNELRSAQTLRVCPYLIQAIQGSDHPIHVLRRRARRQKLLITGDYDQFTAIRGSHPPMHMLRPMKTKHLVLKTQLEPKEFHGIRLLLENSPDLESLTFDMLPPSSISKFSSCAGIDPRTYWMEKITYNCLRKTLKAVVVRNFLCGRNEINVLKYLIRSGSGSGSGPVLERVELYLQNGLDESQKMYANEGAKMLQRISKHVLVSWAKF